MLIISLVMPLSKLPSNFIWIIKSVFRWLGFHMAGLLAFHVYTVQQPEESFEKDYMFMSLISSNPMIIISCVHYYDLKSLKYNIHPHLLLTLSSLVTHSAVVSRSPVLFIKSDRYALIETLFFLLLILGMLLSNCF